MLFNKPHLEFHPLDMTKGFETIEGYPSGIQQKILAAFDTLVTAKPADLQMIIFKNIDLDSFTDHRDR